MPVQDAKGRFTLGNGGPGFPVRLRTVRDMVLSQTRDGQDMIEMLVRIVKDPAIKNDPSAVTAIHLAACAKLLDYGFGKPKEQLEVDLTATYRAMSDAELREVLTQKLIAYAQPGALPE